MRITRRRNAATLLVSYRWKKVCLALLLSLAEIPLPLADQEPLPTLSPLIQSIFPRGGRQGSRFEISIQGKNLQGASRIQVSGTGVECRILRSTESEVRAQVTISPGAAIGRRDLRVLSPRGSFLQAFEVGSLPEQVESKDNDDWSKPPLVKLPLVVNGKILSGDYDHFRFYAQAGQLLVFDLNSSRNGTRFDSVLSLLDAEGNELASQDDFYFDKDSHLEYRFERSGEYVLRVWGYRESGSSFADYRLLMGELPSLSGVFPAGGRSGQWVTITLSGSNLHQVDSLKLNHRAVRSEIIDKSPDRLRARLFVPAAEGFSSLSVQTSGMEVPGPLIFAISDSLELIAADSADPQVLRTPSIVNGCICRPKQKDNFWVDVQAGESLSFEAQGMQLGNYLDPAIAIFDTDGRLVAYMDETAPNGFDKEPPQLDFYLVHRFERAGRYRVEMRDASLRGRAGMIYRLAIKRAEPSFEVIALTNQITILPGQPAKLPVRVRRLGGWNTAVEVSLAGLPEGIRAQPALAEPVNTRFRGTFGEDFFFDGTNVEIVITAAESSALGTHSIVVKGSGVMNEKRLEKKAQVFYPWQQTGYLRGQTQESFLYLTRASSPLFDLQGPASISVVPGKPSEIELAVRWFGPSDYRSLRLGAGSLPQGVRIQSVEIKPDQDKIRVVITAEARVEHLSDRLSLVASASHGTTRYERAAPDIEIKISTTESAGNLSAAK